MITNVSDSRSNPSDQIAHAVKILGRSINRKKVFSVIYHGKAKQKSVKEIAKSAKLSVKQVLKEGKKLADNFIVTQVKSKEGTAYQKDSFYKSHKEKLLALVSNPRKFSQYPTKSTPKPIGSSVYVRWSVPKNRINAT